MVFGNLSVGRYALTLSNAVVLCRHCNCSKFNKDPEIFYGAERCAEIDAKLMKIANKYEKDNMQQVVANKQVDSDLCAQVMLLNVCIDQDSSAVLVEDNLTRDINP